MADSWARIWIAVAALGCMALGSNPVMASAEAGEASAKEWRFRVLLDDKDIGYHSFRVTGNGERQRVEIDARFDVRFLFFNAYSYQHSNVEQWDGPCLREIQSTTRSGRDEYRVSGQAFSEGFALETHADAFDLESSCVRTFAYWDPVVLESKRLLNAQTGEWLNVDVVEAGQETLEIMGRSVPATRYALKLPEGTISLWYGAGQHWLALEAPAPGGRVLRYIPERLPLSIDEDLRVASR